MKIVNTGMLRYYAEGVLLARESEFKRLQLTYTEFYNYRQCLIDSMDYFTDIVENPVYFTNIDGNPVYLQ